MNITLRNISTHSASAPKPAETVSIRTSGLKGGQYAAAIFAAGALVSCASSASGATSISHTRLNATQQNLLIAARQEDTGQELADWMAELKDRAGLTWGQLGTLFAVSRRTIQTWAAGGAISAERRESVAELVERVRAFGDLKAFQIRDRLFGARDIALSGREIAAGEPPILFADARPVPSRLPVTRQGKTRIKKS